MSGRLQAMMRSPIKWAVLLSVVEVALFLGLAMLAGVAPGRGGWVGWVSGAAKMALPHVGVALTAIITTWYVVFTYYLLRAADEARRQAAEPFLLVGWQASGEQTPLTVNNIGELSEKAIGALNRMLRVEPEPREGRHPASLLLLELQNVRAALVGKVEIEVEAEVLPSRDVRLDVEKTRGSLTVSNAKLAQGGRLLVTVADVSGIPEGTEVRVTIARLTYWSVDDSFTSDRFNGERVKIVVGTAKYWSGPPEGTPRVTGGGAQ